MSYKTFRDQCEELLSTNQFYDLQHFLASEKRALLLESKANWYPASPYWIPEFLKDFYLRQIVPIIWAFSKNQYPLAKTQAKRVAREKKLDTIIEMEQKLSEIRYVLFLLLVEFDQMRLIETISGEGGSYCVFETTAEGDKINLLKPPLLEEVAIALDKQLRILLSEKELRLYRSPFVEGIVFYFK